METFLRAFCLGLTDCRFLLDGSCEPEGAYRGREKRRYMQSNARSRSPLIGAATHRTQERLQQTHFYTSPNCPAYAYTYTYQVDHRPRRESSSAPPKAPPLQEGYSPFLMQPGGFPRTVLTVSILSPPPHVTASPDGLPVSLVVGALIPASLTRRRKHV